MDWLYIDPEKCTDCKLCSLVCLHCFSREDEIIVDCAVEENCNMCGHCVAICPTDALVNTNAGLAHETCNSDAEMDDLTSEMYSKVEDAIRKKPENVASLLRYASVGRNLERIADHTTNIAEEVIYMLEGEIIRHKPDKCMPPSEH